MQKLFCNINIVTVDNCNAKDLIVKGAAIFSLDINLNNNVFDIRPSCPFNIGINSTQVDTTTNVILKNVHLPIIKSGTIIPTTQTYNYISNGPHLLQKDHKLDVCIFEGNNTNTLFNDKVGSVQLMADTNYHPHQFNTQLILHVTENHLINAKLYYQKNPTLLSTFILNRSNNKLNNTQKDFIIQNNQRLSEHINMRAYINKYDMIINELNRLHVNTSKWIEQKPNFYCTDDCIVKLQQINNYYKLMQEKIKTIKRGEDSCQNSNLRLMKKSQFQIMEKFTEDGIKNFIPLFYYGFKMFLKEHGKKDTDVLSIMSILFNMNEKEITSYLK